MARLGTFMSHPLTLTVLAVLAVISTILSGLSLAATDPDNVAVFGPKWLHNGQQMFLDVVASVASRLPGVSTQAVAWTVMALSVGMLLVILVVVVRAVPQQREPSPQRLADTSALLAERIIEGDDLKQRIVTTNRRLPDVELEAWSANVERFLGEHYGAIEAAKFRVARLPARRDTGHYTADVWRQLNEVAARLEVLGALGTPHEARSGRSAPLVPWTREPRERESGGLSVRRPPLVLRVGEPEYEGNTKVIRLLVTNTTDTAIPGCRAMFTIMAVPGKGMPLIFAGRLRWLGGEPAGRIGAGDTVCYGFVEVGDEVERDGMPMRDVFHITEQERRSHASIRRGEYLAQVRVRPADEDKTTEPRLFRVTYRGDENLEVRDVTGEPLPQGVVLQ